MAAIRHQKQQNGPFISYLYSRLNQSRCSRAIKEEEEEEENNNNNRLLVQRLLPHERNTKRNFNSLLIENKI